MKKIFIYGVPGSGKTYTSHLLQTKFKTPLLEVDRLRVVAQKNTTEKQSPFLFIGTCQAYKYFGEINSSNCIKGLKAVREAMEGVVDEELKNMNQVIAEAAFLDPNVLSFQGTMLLIITSSEDEHREHFFRNRTENQETLNEFNSARVIQSYLIEEAQELGVAMIENGPNLELKLFEYFKSTQ